MNTVRTADLVFDQIDRLLRLLGVSSAGGLVLGLLRDYGTMSPSEIGDSRQDTVGEVRRLIHCNEKAWMSVLTERQGPSSRKAGMS
jgi:hypothetical protein